MNKRHGGMEVVNNQSQSGGSTSRRIDSFKVGFLKLDWDSQQKEVYFLTTYMLSSGVYLTEKCRSRLSGI